MPSATWQQAEGRCTQYGARLCTHAELPVTRGGGCGHDDDLVWVWDECNHGLGSQRVAVRGNENTNYVCDPVATLHVVRCCADEISGLPPSPPPSPPPPRPPRRRPCPTRRRPRRRASTLRSGLASTRVDCSTRSGKPVALVSRSALHAASLR